MQEQKNAVGTQSTMKIKEELICVKSEMIEVEVKKEPDCNVNVKIEKDREDLYADHVIKEEMVTGPEVFHKYISSLGVKRDVVRPLEKSKTGKQRRSRILEPQEDAPYMNASPLTSPRIKRKKTIMSAGEMEMIVNIFKYLRETWPPDLYRSNCEMVNKTSEMSGVSTRSVYRVLREYKQGNEITEPVTSRRRLDVWKKLDDTGKSAIRKVVHGFFLNGELPTLAKIQMVLNEDESSPTLGTTSLRYVLKKLKFTYVKKHGRSALIDHEDIVLWRVKYLREMAKFRAEKRRIFYLDELTLNAGPTTGAKDSTWKGKILTIVHIGNEDGFLDNGELIFESIKTKVNEESVTAAQFESWFQKVLDKLKPGDVIVMDNARSHRRLVEKLPSMSWLKKDVRNWLQSKHVSYEEDELKVELLVKVNEIKSSYKTYVTDKMAEAKNITILRLPPHHSELSPIEIIWADIKAKITQDKTISDVNNLLKHALAQVTKETWINSVEEVKKVEDVMRGMDHLIDATVDRFLTNVMDGGESWESSTDSDLSLDHDDE